MYNREEFVSGVFVASVGTLVLDSLSKILVWLFVMFFVILCDLLAAVRRVLLAKQPVRFSRAWRNTMSKMVTYFSFVIMVVLMQNAAGWSVEIDKYAILFICFIEMCSIISNILKPAGYNFDVGKLIVLILKKCFSVDKEYSEGIITQKNEEDKRDKE